MKRILLLSVFILSYLGAFATHLIGGNLGYEYVGQFGANYRYKIILTTYTNCDATSNIPQPEGPNLTIGIYGHDVQNDPLNGGDKTWITDATITLVDSNQIDPNLPGNCPIGSNVCIYKGVYEGFVDLPLNFNGYHVFYERCCRNGSIVNLIPSESMAFHAFIPSPLLPNTSPVFTDDPVPFLCAGDTTTILNTAYDPDGDLLVFSFVTPYNGFANSNNPAPLPPQPNLGWNIPNVTYAGGYNMASPFGVGGYSYINGSTGLTSYYPPVTGDYVVAVEIKEYRNGNLIGVTRRDLQLLVLNCSANGTPSLSPSLGSTSTQYTVTEGETLCFDFGYDDPEGDSVTLEVNGQIFDPNSVNPPATVNSPVSGLDTVSTSFCWTTVCGQAQNLPYQFQVSATDNGCPPKANNNVFQITVNPVAPPDTIIGPVIICENSVQTYTTQTVPNTTYNWSVIGGNIIANNGSSVDIHWGSVGAGTVSLSATNQFGCNSAPISLNVTKTSGPTVDAGIDVTICAGDTAQLSASVIAANAYTSSWSPLGNVINGTTLNPSVYPQVTTDYVLTVNMGGGSCINTDTVRVIVNQSVINAGQDTALCIGDTVQLGASGATSYNWSPNIAINDVAVSNPLVYPTTTQSYIVSGTDANGCFGSDTVTVNVNSLPIVSAGEDVWVCPGGTAQLNATGGVTYAWSPNFNISDTTIANPVVTPTVDTSYIVQVTDTNGCVNSDTVLVAASRNVPTDAGMDTTICAGDSIVIGGNPTAVNGTDYAWVPSASIIDSTLANPTVFPLVTTAFIVYTSNDTCTGTDTILVTVNPLPIIDAGNAVQICIGDTAQLNASGGVSYSWNNGQLLTNDQIADPMAFPVDTTSFIVTSVDANGCVNTDTTQVIVNPLPNANAGLDTLICHGDSAQLMASGGESYAWSPSVDLADDSIANPWSYTLDSTTYYVAVTDSNGCVNNDSVNIAVYPLPIVNAGSDQRICVNDTVQLTATGASLYLWTPGDSLSDSTTSSPFAFPIVTTTYVVEGTYNYGCSNTDTVTVFVNQSPTISTSPTVQICVGDSVEISASGGDAYAWSPNVNISDTTIANPVVYPTVTTTYLVAGFDTIGCGSQGQVTVVVNSLPTLQAHTQSTVNVCIGDTTQLQASGAVSYTWTPSQSLSSAIISNPFAFPQSTTEYTVVGTDGNGCENSASVTVEVFEVSTMPDTAICVGESVSLFVNGAPGDVYSWSPTTGLDNPSIATPTATPTNTTTYVVSVTDVAGCQDQAQVTITTLSAPQSSFSTQVEADCEGTTVRFTNNSTNASSYNWTFSDGTTSTEENPVHLFDYDGTYSAVLVTTDPSGCNDTLTINGNTLIFNDLFSALPPNVFTPNGDGDNDFFEVALNPEIEECTSFVVFNRWGQLIFESDGSSIKWDGKKESGRKVPEGTYFYIIDLNGVVYKGTLSLFR
ncbi:MAG: gliding motility-associated C-terminal domain-containing protein [Flavobacteriales bacterium]|jgi:gliding motility-associated-like protein|nr:gliding motility-associated C-terminal domain-containing protein [Flavobacteriales bacterium]